MKAVIIFHIYVAFHLTIFPNGVRGNDSNIKILDKFARNGKIINRIFKPSINGSLGVGFYGITYKGRLLPRNNMEVAMKFSPLSRLRSSNKEFEFYTYLNAINNPHVEINGVPAIYYFGICNNNTMLAMTLLDSGFQTKIKDRKIEEMDVFIAFREFVRIIKYIHSRGIIHMDISNNNMIIQNGQGFIFDYGLSVDMNEYTREKKIENVKYDFKRFILAMFEIVRRKSNWHWLGLISNEDAFRMKNISNFINKLLEEAKSSEANQFRGLRRIFVEIAKHAFDDTSTGSKDANGTWIPFYDQLYQVIYEECENYGSEAKTSISSISYIPDPFGIKKWSRPFVDYELFDNMYAKQIQDAKNKGCVCCFS